MEFKILLKWYSFNTLLAWLPGEQNVRRCRNKMNAPNLYICLSISRVMSFDIYSPYSLYLVDSFLCLICYILAKCQLLLF